MKSRRNPFQAAPARRLPRGADSTPDAQVLERLFQQAIGSHREGRLPSAEKIYRDLLAKAPQHFDLLHMLGVVCWQQGRGQEGLGYLDRALAIQPQSAPACSNRGNILRDLGRFDEALQSCTRAIELDQGFAVAYCNRATVFLAMGRHAEAMADADAALRIQPNLLEAMVCRARVFQALQRYSDAVAMARSILQVSPNHLPAWHAAMDALLAMVQAMQAAGGVDETLLRESEQVLGEVLRRQPDFFQALHNRAIIRQMLRRHEEALTDLDAVLQFAPAFTQAHITRGNVLLEMQRHSEAAAAFDNALALQPANADCLASKANALIGLLNAKTEGPLLNVALLGQIEKTLQEAIAANPHFFEARKSRANVLHTLKRSGEALGEIDAALVLVPSNPDAHFIRGNILRELKRFPDAIAAYDHAIALCPQNADAFLNKGQALIPLFRPLDALSAYDAALRVNPDFAEAHYRRAILLQDLKRFGEAEAAFGEAVRCDEDQPKLFGQWIGSSLMTCHWDRLDAKLERLAQKIHEGKNAASPFWTLTAGLGLELTKRSTITMMRETCWGVSQTFVCPPPYAGERLRIGYFSSDFREHAVSQLAVGVFESHDRSGFDIFGINTSTLPPDAMTARVERAFGGLVEIGALPLGEALGKVRALRLDIAIDLNGHTQGAWHEIFARRVAPIQVNYLGFPGTSGTDYMDYILADSVVIPPQHFSGYTEKVAHLPHCYLPNDSSKAIAVQTPTRAEAGLPESGFVFCCFNNSYKINEEVFSVWMRLLQRVSGSVLWLSRMNDDAIQNLRRLAAACGVDPQRLLFAPRTHALADHLARHRLADLFLDTTRYNAHTTASDALWAGLPVLTCLGEAFPGRVAASLLQAVGLPELIAATLQDYETLALRLASEPELLRALRLRLEQNKNTTPLFNTPLFARNLEAVLQKMWARHSAAQPPAHLE
jgi:protein O-GlcNAc transferase